RPSLPERWPLRVDCPDRSALVESAYEPSQVIERDGACGGPCGPLVCDQPTDEGPHRCALISKDTQVARRVTEEECLGQGVHGRGVITIGCERERQQRLNLD